MTDRAARPPRPDRRQRDRDARRLDARASHLDETGRAQAAALAATAAPRAARRGRDEPAGALPGDGRGPAGRPGRSAEHVDDRLGECAVRRLDRAAAQGRSPRTRCGRSVQAHPSARDVPGRRRVDAGDAAPRRRRRARAGTPRSAPDATLDRGLPRRRHQGDRSPTRSGMHLDQFQRIQVDPCSVTVVRYTELRPFVVRLNDTGGASTRCCRRSGGRRRSGARRLRRDAVGGGAGAEPARPERSRHRLVTRATPGLRVRPARPVRRRHRRRARRAHVLPAGRAPAAGSPAWRWRSSRCRVLAERVDELLDEVLRRSGGDGAGPGRRPGRAATTSRRWTSPSPRSSGSAPWRWPGTRRPSGSSSRPARPPRRRGRRPRRRARRRPGPPAGAASPAPLARASSSARWPWSSAGRPPCPFCGPAARPGRPHLPPAERLPPARLTARLVRDGEQRAGSELRPARAAGPVRRRRAPAADATASSTCRAGWSTRATPRCSARSTLDGVAAMCVLQADRGGAAAVGLPRRDAGRPRGRDVRGLRGHRLGPRAADGHAGRARSGLACASCGSTSTRRWTSVVLRSHASTRTSRRMVVLDAVVNNADRKGGHLLPRPDGRVQGVDHGVTFNDRGQAAHRAVELARRAADDEAVERPGVGSSRTWTAPDGPLGARLRDRCSTRRRGRPATAVRGSRRLLRDGDLSAAARATGRPCPGRRSEPRSPVGSPACRPGPAPTVPTLPGTGLPLRLCDTAPASRPGRCAGADRAHVRLRHHALRRHAHRAREHLRDLRPAAARLARRRPRGRRTSRTSPTSTTRCSSAPTATGEDWRDLAARETELFRTDMAALRVLPPTEYVGAVEAIPRIVALIERAAGARGGVRRRRRLVLLRRAATPASAPVAPGSTAQRCSSCSPNAGATPTGRARRTRSTACCGGPRGRASRRGTRPLGPGRPGWHVECTPIALDHLGDRLRPPGRRPRPGLPAPRDECVARLTCALDVAVRLHVRPLGMVGLDGRRCRSPCGNLVLVSRSWRPARTRWRSGSRCCRTTTARDWEWTPALLVEPPVPDSTPGDPPWPCRLVPPPTCCWPT